MEASLAAMKEIGIDSGLSVLTDYDAIAKTMESYNEGVRQGKSAVMKPAFHAGATFFGHYEGQVLAGPAQILFDWVDGNGPSPDIRVRITSTDIHLTVAVVQLEVENMTGKLAGTTGARLSDLFQLIKIGGEWKISQKSFHWHTA